MSSTEKPWTAAYHVGQRVEILDSHNAWVPGIVATLSHAVLTVHVVGGKDDETFGTRAPEYVRADYALAGPEHMDAISVAVGGMRMLLDGLAESAGTPYAITTAIGFLMAEFVLDTTDDATPEVWLEALVRHAKAALPAVQRAREAGRSGT